MAFSKKKKRKIAVDEKIYYWSATGNDGWISLCIMTEIEGSPRFNCKFESHHLQIESKYRKILAKQFVITPYTVCQTILYALSIGWNPSEKGKDINLHHVDGKVDLQLPENRAINDKDLWFQLRLYVASK